ncbi:unnamed protein product [Cyprideis torosa]|uniref:Uncharacterized protein n=1 Tax=Cyprideis torosa TaxID=163714 RepID=A0A7R8ZVL6_9CRUS|nr:unnamed protein product [Cyprideis torosa]CAG0907718.1 unnamed protein product [Cyprideis torosa]
MNKASDSVKIRLDKWLWAARFFKTRSLASAAVNGGKVHVNDQRVKASRSVNLGDSVRVHRGFDTYDIIVQGLTDKRGSATIAQTLYSETPESVAKREEATAMRKAQNAGMRPSEGRPSGRNRRGKVVLIERRYEPLGWALPGGFVDVGERLESAAVREAKEEISLEVELVCLLGCYSDPERDARGHTVSAVFIGDAQGKPVAADDAKTIALVEPDDQSHPLAFDHGLIMKDYRRWLETGEVAPLRF